MIVARATAAQPSLLTPLAGAEHLLVRTAESARPRLPPNAASAANYSAVPTDRGKTTESVRIDLY